MRALIFLLTSLIILQLSTKNIEAQKVGRPILSRVFLHTLVGGGVGALGGSAFWLTDPYGPGKFTTNVGVGVSLGIIIGFGLGLYEALASVDTGGTKALTANYYIPYEEHSTHPQVALDDGLNFLGTQEFKNYRYMLFSYFANY